MRSSIQSLQFHSTSVISIEQYQQLPSSTDQQNDNEEVLSSASEESYNCTCYVTSSSMIDDETISKNGDTDANTAKESNEVHEHSETENAPRDLLLNGEGATTAT